MPMFNPRRLASPYHPKNWRSCLLCQQKKADYFQCCRACWQDLPWSKQTVYRQDVQCFTALHYDFPINRIVQQFKDHAQLAYGDFLLGCLLEMPKPAVQAIVAMPLATEKLIARGFNQSVYLAKKLSQAWQIPLWQPIARRDAHSQRGLSRQERLDNLHGLFYPIMAADKRYRRILMLDDVITTGASLGALQQQLQALNCNDIQALCLCDAAHQN